MFGMFELTRADWSFYSALVEFIHQPTKVRKHENRNRFFVAWIDVAINSPEITAGTRVKYSIIATRCKKEKKKEGISNPLQLFVNRMKPFIPPLSPRRSSILKLIVHS